MSIRKYAAPGIVTAILGVVFSGIAVGQSLPPDQTPPQDRRSVKTLANQLDELGQMVFGNLLSNGSEGNQETQPSRSASRRYQTQRVAPIASGTRAGGQMPATRANVDRTRQTATTAKSGPVPLSELLGSGGRSRPLHERLAAFQRSAFGSNSSKDGNNKTTDQNRTPPAAGPTTEKRPQKAQDKAAVPVRSMQATPMGRPVIAQRNTVTTPPKQSTMTARQPVPSVATRPAPTANPMRPTPAARPTATATARPNFATTPTVATKPRGATPTAADPAKRPAEPEDNLLFSRKGPVLGVETLGPRKIAVGKESRYVITVQNAGEIGADKVVVHVALPMWADVLGADASAGTTHSAVAEQGNRSMQWSVGQLQGGHQEQLTVRIVPRESRPFDLATRCEYKPVASQALIEVQEPKLAIRLEGPRDVLYGEKEIYRLHLSNSGNGEAENLLIQLMPIGSGGNQPVSHNLGNLKAGESKTVEVELTARQVGRLTVRVDVRGDGVHAELAEQVLVRRAALQLEATGPTVQYVGAVAAFQLHLSNPGTADAKNVRISVDVPTGAEYVSGIDDARVEISGGKLQWTVNHLEPGAQRQFNVKCRLGLSGTNRLGVVATADGELTATAAATTSVEAMADLVLEVKDPSGPVPVGEETTYELCIRNRGTKIAENVEVVAYFSRGIEPVTAEGRTHRIGQGQVVFSPIPSVAAAGELVLKIRACAESAGNHIFRAEVHCKPLGTRLVSEESTYFYRDGPAAMPQEVPTVAEREAAVQDRGTPLRVADQQQSPIVPHKSDRTMPDQTVPGESSADEVPAEPQLILR